MTADTMSATASTRMSTPPWATPGVRRSRGASTEPTETPCGHEHAAGRRTTSNTLRIDIGVGSAGGRVEPDRAHCHLERGNVRAARACRRGHGEKAPNAHPEQGEHAGPDVTHHRLLQREQVRRVRRVLRILLAETLANRVHVGARLAERDVPASAGPTSIECSVRLESAPACDRHTPRRRQASSATE
jgi:hypothetical protein